MWRTTRAQITILGAATVFLASCGHRHKTARVPRTPQPSTASAGSKTRANGASTGSLPNGSRPNIFVGYTEQGTASWYGVPYHGRPAADGEIYNMETLVAAHRVIPFNTWLRVTNLQNLKTVDVRVIDRGPFVDGRIIDLSKAAARQIDLLGPGIGPVRLEVIAAPADIPSNDFYTVQVGAFSIRANAERLRSEYAERFGSAQVTTKQGNTPLYRVLVGKQASMVDAQRLADTFRSEGKNAFVVRLDETITGSPMSANPE